MGKSEEGNGVRETTRVNQIEVNLLWVLLVRFIEKICKKTEKRQVESS